MDIVLGSTSSQKLNILKKALDESLVIGNVQEVPVNSGVPELPLSLEQTTQGAINRAKEALHLQQKANLAVGLEVGLEDKSGVYWLVCVAAFWDGEHLITGQSGQLPLPMVVSDGIKQGKQFDELIQEYQRTAPVDEQERIGRLVSREIPLTEAINQALPDVKRQVGNDPLQDAIALFASERGAGLLLKLSSACFGLFFGLRALIALASPILGLMQDLQPWFAYNAFFIALSIFMVLGLIFIMIGLWRLAEKSSLQQELSLTRAAKMAALSYIPYVVIWIVMIYFIAISSYGTLWILYKVWSDVLMWLAVISVIAISVSHFLLLRQSQTVLNSTMTTSILIAVGVISLIVITRMAMQQEDGAQPFISPLYIMGLCWSIGLWRLADDIRSFGQSKPSVADIDKYLDRG